MPGTVSPIVSGGAPIEATILWNEVEDPDPTTWVTDQRLVDPRTATVPIDGSLTANLDYTFTLVP